ncbi:MAG: class I SAM-dependent methyltransferase [Phycisphaerae bacterium]|jgi:SAM-dependent methyltransferase
MTILKKAKFFIYRRLRSLRCRQVLKVLRKDARTILDIGCQEDYFKAMLGGSYDYTGADFAPLTGGIDKQDVQALTYADDSFDIVLCQQVLEHVSDPVRAMGELRRVAKQQLVITVPNEPQFTNARLGRWEKEHLWAIKPAAFEAKLGKPDICRNIVWGRYTMLVWEF